MPTHRYRYRVADLVDRGYDPIIDGDTFDLVLDLGFFAFKVVRVRLVGPDGAAFDAPEVYGRNASEAGHAAKEAARTWISERVSLDRLRIETFADPEHDRPVPDGAFGRWLGNLYDAETYGDTLYAWMTERGFNEEA